MFALWVVYSFNTTYAFSVVNSELSGFLLLLFLAAMSLLRWRVQNLKYTVLADIVVCLALSIILEFASIVLALPLFSAMYLGIYPAALIIAFLFYSFDPFLAAVLSFAVLIGLFLGLWEKERHQKLVMRDMTAGRYYELEGLQSDLTSALSQVERMTSIAERTRIAHEIHDNAGHEIVAAYISLQTARDMFKDANKDALELYDAALERLNSGTNKIRNAVHNLSAVSDFGAGRLKEICRRFPACGVDFNIYGDTSKVAVYIWAILESCLNESLTNVARHSSARYVSVDLDVTPYIIRLSIENDGVRGNDKQAGSGLRNLRRRAEAVGGSISIDAGQVFKVVCVIPISKEN